MDEVEIDVVRVHALQRFDDCVIGAFARVFGMPDFGDDVEGGAGEGGRF